MRALISRAKARGIPVLTASLQPEAPIVNELRGQKVLAFAAIGHPDKFFATLNAAGVLVRGTRAFADHHHFSRHEASALLDKAAIEHLTLVTTEKDMARLRGDPALAALAQQTTVLPVAMTIDDDYAVKRDIIDKVLKTKEA